MLLYIICQVFVLTLCGLSISRSQEHMYSSSSLHKLRSDSDAHSCASSTFCPISSRSSCAALSSSLALRSCFSPFLVLGLVPSSTLASSAMPSDVASISVSLFEPSLQHLIQVLFLFFHEHTQFLHVVGNLFPLCSRFRAFHLSCELCPASSTAERCQLDFEFQSFDDQQACFSDIARLSTAMGREERGDEKKKGRTR